MESASYCEIPIKSQCHPALLQWQTQFLAQLQRAVQWDIAHSQQYTHYKGSHTQGPSPTIPRLSTPNRQTCIYSICMLSYDQHRTNPEIRTLSNQVPLHSCPHNSLTTHWKALQMLEWHRHIRSKPAYTLFDPLKYIHIVARAFSDVCTRQIAGSCAVT